MYMRGLNCTMQKTPIFYCILCYGKAEVLNKEAIYLSYVLLLQMINWSTRSAHSIQFTFFFIFNMTVEMLLSTYFTKISPMAVTNKMRTYIELLYLAHS